MLGLSLTLGATALLGAGGGSPPAPAFDPATLFAGGSTGFIIDPSNNTTMLDSLLNSVEVGEGVRRVTSVYFGDWLEQATSTRRPIYQMDGEKHYLQFDGVDDTLSKYSAGAWWIDADTITVMAGIRKAQNVNMEDVFGLGTNPPAINGGFNLAATYDPSSNTAGIGTRGTSAAVPARAGNVLVGSDYVLTGIGHISGDIATIRRNGVVMQTNTLDQGAGNYANTFCYIGSRGGGSRFFSGRLYGMFAINRLLTAEELAGAEGWMASKCGVTL
jgi:hypothetical protein